MQKNLNKITGKHSFRNITQEIERAQEIIESQNFEIRKNLKKYNDLIEQHRQIVYKTRYDLLTRQISLNITSKRCPERYMLLSEKYGEGVPIEAERRIALHFINECWEEYLGYAAYIREGIHLVNVAGTDPYTVFNREISKAFEDMQEKIIESTVDVFNSAEIDENGIDIEKEGLKGPSATWTYIVDDSSEQLGILKLLGNPISYTNPVFIPLLIITGIINRFVTRKKALKKSGYWQENQEDSL
ncbi:MAG: hypothetical protein Q8920_01210 [Bacillota bacterium]|nr:hypothetical protein [Bacillota bacterium]